MRFCIDLRAIVSGVNDALFGVLLIVFNRSSLFYAIFGEGIVFSTANLIE
jgi:hypothetical protein